MMSLVIALLVVFATWGLFSQSLHLSFDGVPAGVDLNAVKTCLAGFRGVAEVHDLHIWAIGASETAMTVHLVMPDGHPGDAFLVEVSESLHHGFSIEHATIQIEIGDAGQPCRLATHVTA